MSIRDLNKTVIVTDALNGQVIDVIDKSLYNEDLICNMIKSLFYNDMESEHGLIIKYGYKN